MCGREMARSRERAASGALSTAEVCRSPWGKDSNTTSHILVAMSTMVFDQYCPLAGASPFHTRHEHRMLHFWGVLVGSGVSI